MLGATKRQAFDAWLHYVQLARAMQVGLAALVSENYTVLDEVLHWVGVHPALSHCHHVTAQALFDVVNVEGVIESHHLRLKHCPRG